MRTLSIALLCLISVAAFGQTPSPTPALPQNIYAGGVSYNNAATPGIAGTAVYAHLLNDGSGTYSFSAIDILPISVKPFNVSTSVGTGVAQKLFTISKANVYIASSVGIQTDGSNTGWSWTGGGTVDIPIKNGWGVMPTVRFNKGSATAGAGYQLIGGVLLRFGK